MVARRKKDIELAPTDERGVVEEGGVGTLVYQLVESYTRACGIVEKQLLYELYGRLVDDPMDMHAFDKALEVTTHTCWEEGPGFWTHAGTTYIANGAITDRGYLWGLWLQAKHAAYPSEEEYERTLENLKRDEPIYRKVIEADRLCILDSHQGKPIREFSRTEVESELAPLLLESREMQDVRSYIRGLPQSDDRHGEANEWNLDFALQRTAFSFSDRGVPTEEELGIHAGYCLALAGVFDPTEEETTHVKGLLARSALRLPLWGLNGHDATWIARTPYGTTP